MKKLAVLGGGMGSLAAVYAITSDPEWQQHYQITVYQIGFRLGGKGASGRNLDLGPEKRIEEHGLHIWLGHYENAFRVLRACYEQLKALDPSTPDWNEAFKPFRDVMLMELHRDEWKAWPVPDMSLPGVPGDGEPLPFPHRNGFFGRPPGEIERMAELYNLVTAPARIIRGGFGDEATLPGAQRALRESVDRWFKQAAEDPGAAQQAWESGPERALAALEAAAGDPPDTTDGALDWFRRMRIVSSLTRAIGRAVVHDRLIERGYQAVDDREFAEYLLEHGASQAAIDSAVVRGAYQLAFAFRDGDVNRPAFAAGTGIRCLLLLGAASKGALFWKMQGAMGDIVFAPFYRVLKARGVDFQFFHAVRDLEVSGNRISAIKIARQVDLKPGRERYEPLVELDIGGKIIHAWPSRPLYDQLDFDPHHVNNTGKDFESDFRAPQEVETLTILDGQHYDQVILGISIAGVAEVGAALARENQRFGRMLESVKTVQTQALQLWFTSTTADLGWTLEPPVLDGFEEPFDTWADMTHLIRFEGWPAASATRSCAYLCSVLPEEPHCPRVPYDVQLTRTVRRNARAWLDESSRFLWPEATDDQGFRWDLLVAPPVFQGEKRLDGQYFRANVSASERYVLSVPGSTKHRLRANESGFENLVLAGDWLRTGLSAGCIEAATMGGLQAAEAVTGRSQNIVRDDEPG